MKRLPSRFLLIVSLLTACFIGSVSASPFGQGKFGANVPFGASTSLSINLGSNVAITMAPSGQNFSGTGSHNVTVTSTDVVGYQLYAHCLTSCNLVNGSSTISASSNSTAGSLSVNSWGYNTDGSGNFLGMSTTPALLKDATGPYESGDSTTITYGALAGVSKDAGSYQVTVIYTAIAKNP